MLRVCGRNGLYFAERAYGGFYFYLRIESGREVEVEVY
jgi:hypothetical protein